MAKKASQANQVSKLGAIRNALNVNFSERGEAVDGILIALLSREMIFMLGAPGTGKSALARAVCSAITGKYFEKIFAKTSAPEELYGPYRLTALQRDEYIRNTTGQLPECDVAYLDEIFKGSSAILNTLLPILNERIFHNNGVVHIPLQTCVAASNELPQGEELGALWDRFSLRFLIHKIQDDGNFKTMLRAQMQGGQAAIPTMTLAELKAEQAAALKLEISDEIMDLLTTIRRECDQASFYVSDRKWVQITRLIRAQAHLRGHSKVETEDLDIMQHVLWHDDKQISAVRKLVMKHCNPIGEILVDIRDAVTEISIAAQKPSEHNNTAEGMEMYNKVKKHLKKINDLTKEYPTNSALIDLKQFATQVGQKISVKYLELA